MEWNEQTEAQITALWVEGLTTVEIGRRMGITKNAVVGKARRLDLPGRPSPIKRDVPRAPRPSRAGKPTQKRESGTGLLVGPTLPPMTLPALRLVAAISVHGPRACCWPFGDPRTPEFRFCGKPVAGRSYCAKHLKRAYVQTRRQEIADAA